MGLFSVSVSQELAPQKNTAISFYLWFCFVDYNGLDLMIYLPQTPECYDYRNVPDGELKHGGQLVDSSQVMEDKMAVWVQTTTKQQTKIGICEP